MKRFFRKLLGIQTLQFVLVNPDMIGGMDISAMSKNLPAYFIVTHLVKDMKVIDSNIVVKKTSESKASASSEAVNA